MTGFEFAAVARLKGENRSAAPRNAALPLMAACL